MPNLLSLLVVCVAIGAVGCTNIGYVDEEPCADGSSKIRRKPRHGPSVWECAPPKNQNTPSENSSQF